MVREISPIKDLVVIMKLRREIKRVKPDVLYLHSAKAGALGRIASFGLKHKIVYNPHGWSFTIDCSQIKKRMYAFVEKFLSVKSDLIINISDDEFLKAKEAGLNHSKMTIINNGIDVYKYKKNTKLIYSERIVIGFVGRLDQQKNPVILIEIAKKLIHTYPNVLFYIVGDGALREELETNIFNEGLSKYFYFTGWVDNVESEIRNFDLALLTSKWEGFGLVVCEYMAAKKPVVSVEVGGVKNIITNNIDGILIKNYDVDAFVESITSLLEDKTFYKYIVNNAYKTVKSKYSIKTTIEASEKQLKKLMELER